MAGKEFVEPAGIAGLVVETQLNVVQRSPEVVSGKVIPESALAFATLVRTPFAAVANLPDDEVGLRIEPFAKQPRSHHPGIERRGAEIGEPVARREVRIDEDIGNLPCIELASEGDDPFGEERRNDQRIECLVVQAADQGVERGAVILVEVVAPHRDVEAPGLDLGPGDAGIEIGPILPGGEVRRHHRYDVTTARGQRTGDQIGTVVDLFEYGVDPCEIFGRDLAPVVDHAVDRCRRDPRHAGDIDDADGHRLLFQRFVRIVLHLFPIFE